MNIFDELFGSPLKKAQREMQQKVAPTPSALQPDSQRQYRKSLLKRLLKGIGSIVGSGIAAGVLACVIPSNESESFKTLFLLPLALLFLGLRLVIVGSLGFLCGMPLREFNGLMELKPWWQKAVFVLVGGILLALAVTFPAWIIFLWVRFKQ